MNLLRWTVPSLGSVLCLAALANGLYLRVDRLFTSDGDVGRHVRVGRTILETGAIPRVDLFSHTRLGDRFIPYEWLSEAITAAVHGVTGLAGVAVLSALLYVVAVFGVYRAAETLGAPRLLALPVAVLGLTLQSVHLLPRPHLFTTALAAVFLIVLLRFARSGQPWLLAPLPLLMLLWANAHGGFLIGFILLAAFIAGSLLRSDEFVDPIAARKSLIIVAVLCLAASFLNPAGHQLWLHTTGYLGIEFLVAATQEYRSIDFHQPYGKVFLVGLFAGPALWMTGRIRVSWLAAGLYLFFGAAALHSARNIPLFTVVVLPWIALWITEAVQAQEPSGPRIVERLRRLEAVDRTLRPGLSTVIGLVMIGYAIGPFSSAYRFDRQSFPVAAGDVIHRTSAAGNVFNQMKFGGYLLYAHPNVKVFIDGQTDFYGEALSRDYLQALKGGPGWEAVLSRHEIDWTLLGKGEPLNQLLALHPEWGLVHEDSVAVVYRRSQPQVRSQQRGD